MSYLVPWKWPSFFFCLDHIVSGATKIRHGMVYLGCFTDMFTSAAFLSLDCSTPNDSQLNVRIDSALKRTVLEAMGGSTKFVWGLFHTVAKGWDAGRWSNIPWSQESPCGLLNHDVFWQQWQGIKGTCFPCLKVRRHPASPHLGAGNPCPIDHLEEFPPPS